MNKKQIKLTEQQENLICTFVRLYPFNISFALQRASEMVGVNLSTIRSRYYSRIRKQRKIFIVKFGEIEIINTSRMSSQEIVKYHLDKVEPNYSEEFEKIEK